MEIYLFSFARNTGHDCGLISIGVAIGHNVMPKPLRFHMELVFGYGRRWLLLWRWSEPEPAFALVLGPLWLARRAGLGTALVMPEIELEEAPAPVATTNLPKLPKGRLSPALSVDWPAVRLAFIEATERPTYKELEERFNCPTDRLMRVSSDEGWPALRAARMEERIKLSDAGAAIVRAAKVDTVAIRGLGELAIDIIAKLKATVDKIEDKKSVTTRMNTLNTATFAYKNLCDGLARIGIVGLPKSLREAAGGSNGQWSPQMLSSINLTVQNIVAGKAATEPVQVTSERSVTDLSEPAQPVGGAASVPGNPAA